MKILSLQATIPIRACPCGERILARSKYYWISFSLNTYSNEITISGKNSQRFNLISGGTPSAEAGC